MALSYPLINGVRYDHSSLDIKLSGVSWFGTKSLDYTDSLEPGDVMGTTPQRIARTRGPYKCSGSLEVYRAEYDAFALQLTQQFPGVGLLEIAFDIVVNYMPEGGLSIVSDTLKGCRMKSRAVSAPGGGEAIGIKIELDPMYIMWNGISPITALRK